MVENKQLEYLTIDGGIGGAIDNTFARQIIQ